jgi:hypothetical protein
MEHLVEFALADGDSVLVEVAGGDTGPVTRGLGAGAVVEKAGATFEEALERVRPAVQAVIGTLRTLSEPDQVTVQFGLDLRAEAGALIAQASTGANFSVSLTWRRQPEDDGGQRPRD